MRNMFSLSEYAEHSIHERSVSTLRVSIEQVGIFRLFIDEPRKLDLKVNNNNKLIPVLQKGHFSQTGTARFGLWRTFHVCQPGYARCQ